MFANVTITFNINDIMHEVNLNNMIAFVQINVSTTNKYFPSFILIYCI
jgi:hypothetical protein